MISWLKKYSIFTRILSVFIAILIWFFVVSELNPDMDKRFKNIDIQITDIEQLTGNGLAIVSGGNATADVRVRGKRDKIALLEADSFKITASVASITVPGTYNLTYMIDVPDVSVVSKKPAQISVVIDHISSKTIPASINFIGNMPSSYFLNDFNLSPDAIVVKGPQTQLDEIYSAVLSFSVKDMKKSIETTLSYTLVDKNGEPVDMTGLSVDTPAIVLSADVKQQKELPLTVDFISEGIFSESIIQWSIEPKSVTVSGDPLVLSTINQINLGTVNLKTLITSRAENVDYAVNLPNGIIADSTVNSAVLNVQTPEYEFKKIIIPSEAFEPVDGYSYLAGSAITVDIFGDEDILKKITSADFKVVTDNISSDSDGVAAIASLEVTSRYSDIVILGSHTVPVIIKLDNPDNTAR